MFKKILIANRGEIALRIIRACKEMGIRTVAAHSTADANSLPVRMADQAVCIGPGEASKSYLRIPALISAAEVTSCDAVHPGYGFLSENAGFAEVCGECNITFIGPSPESIRLMGNKSVARETAVAAGVPVVPGSDGPVESDEAALSSAARIEYPVILKASAGGGGRGMRIVHEESELLNSLKLVQTEAGAAFGDKTIYMEKYVTTPRHIEIQVLGDKHGNIVHLFERDCSIQRRHQKMIEEAPSGALDPEIRKKMTIAALSLARHIQYHSAGTFEFLLDSKKNFYFMEMNTRVQVEHPVTEMITDVDIIKEQIKVAFGLPLSFKQEDVSIFGHAIECRVNAEDPEKFIPSIGRIEELHLPGGPGVRIDSAIFQGYKIPSYYDSMIAKIIVHAHTRDEAIHRMRRALGEFHLSGMKTTVPLLSKIMYSEEFTKGDVSTRFIEDFLAKQKAASVHPK
ncbi:MAG: acetyl-CoA carboxylase biotin carboxylase subunit [Nitrospinae bacterium]|nr:acetyl-CoA carboxylase biotin carboxylase subunit [Nitrospinota bacterium]